MSLVHAIGSVLAFIGAGGCIVAGEYAFALGLMALGDLSLGLAYLVDIRTTVRALDRAHPAEEER